jgi:hypothetical protein
MHRSLVFAMPSMTHYWGYSAIDGPSLGSCGRGAGAEARETGHPSLWLKAESYR